MTKCPDCLAHYTGKHECDGLMTMLVEEHKKKPSTRKATSEEKAYKFWYDNIREKESDHEVYIAGLQWMIEYWQKKLYEALSK